jgi:ribosome modulation factor
MTAKMPVFVVNGDLLAAAYRKGSKAGRSGKKRETNPFQRPPHGMCGHSTWGEWDRGHQAGKVRGRTER